MRRLLIPLLAALALPAAVNAEADPKVHKLCLPAADYEGCIKVQTNETRSYTSDKSVKSIQYDTRELPRNDKSNTIVLFNPGTVIARNFNSEWGRHISYRYVLKRGNKSLEIDVDADCFNYKVDWKGDETPWFDVRGSRRKSHKEAKSILDEFCPQINRLVKEAKARNSNSSDSTFLPFQYPKTPKRLSRLRFFYYLN
jgi:hypothetical protein